MATGNRGCEAYTAIAWGVGLSHERSDIAGAESLYSLEGNMCGTAMRGAVALPGSKATSRAKGSHRNLGDLISDPLALCLNGPRREGEEPTPAMYGGEKSDRAIVAMKLANKAEEIGGGVGGAKGEGRGKCSSTLHARRTQRRRRCTNRWTAAGR